MARGTVRAPTQSFIVRVSSDIPGGVRMHGEIEHVGTGERRYFSSYWMLLQQLESWRQDVEATG